MQISMAMELAHLILLIDHADVIAMQNKLMMKLFCRHKCLVQSPLSQLRRKAEIVMRIQRCAAKSCTISAPDFSSCGPQSSFEVSYFEHSGSSELPIVKKSSSDLDAEKSTVYERFDAESIAEVDDARLEYFTKKVCMELLLRVFPNIKDSIQIKGVQNLIIYSLPERKEFYPEVLNMLEGSHNMTCTVLFSRFDQLHLERIVGSAAAKRLTTSDKGIFIFC
ncbi:hypothetical protein Cgig2_025912 [Carnegiea gigantea]|uniref:UTP25 C-terminal domain-containing protein n=1 Tax=Carnegiea gigantea TaxID=171969 RepID=A0A9Q1K612_9CARY|nr:hypothetical protein Cgig2_025912 [Carnegiea gigantea]